jgi:hypothetical protein
MVREKDANVSYSSLPRPGALASNCRKTGVFVKFGKVGIIRKS